MLFLGQAEVTIDAKQRLAIPAKYRAQHPAAPEAKAEWVSVPWPDGGVIRLYPQPAFERLAAMLNDSLFPEEDAAKLDSIVFGSAELIEADSAGRLRMPKRHLDLVGLTEGSEVMVLGVRNRLEVRDRAAWLAGEQQRLHEMPGLVKRLNERSRGGTL